MEKTQPVISLKSSDDIRGEILAIFESFKPQVASYSEYAAKVAALGEEYFKARVRETFPSCEIMESTKIYEGELHATPTTVDRAIAAIKAAGKSPLLMVVDRANQKITLLL